MSAPGIRSEARDHEPLPGKEMTASRIQNLHLRCDHHGYCFSATDAATECTTTVLSSHHTPEVPRVVGNDNVIASHRLEHDILDEQVLVGASGGRNARADRKR